MCALFLIKWAWPVCTFVPNKEGVACVCFGLSKGGVDLVCQSKKSKGGVASVCSEDVWLICASVLVKKVWSLCTSVSLKEAWPLCVLLFNL